MTWCLTGEIYRPQRPPESGAAEFEYRVDRRPGESPIWILMALIDARHSDAFLQCLPTGRLREGSSSRHLVELTLVDDQGQELTIRRRQFRDAREKLVDNVTGLDDLALDPISCRIGTTMPGPIPHIRLGDPSELGKAISELTGLAGLVELARHAERVRARLEKEFIPNRQRRISQLDEEFTQESVDLRAAVLEFPAMAPPELQLRPGDPNLEASLQVLAAHFDLHQEQALTVCGEILVVILIF